MVEVKFNAERHEYRVNGKRWPSVTEVLAPLSDFDAVPRHVLDAAAEFGTHVHMACEMEFRGVLDERALDPALAPYLAGWRLFRRESGFAIIEMERRVLHEKLGYAGTLDVLAQKNAQTIVLDIKSGQVPRTVGPQTAAYADCLNTTNNVRYCLQLTPGAYRLHKLTDRADLSIFVSCLNIWRFKNAN